MSKKLDKTHERAFFDPHLNLPVIPGKPHTIESLVAVLAKQRKTRDISMYRIVKATGMDVGYAAVKRLLTGYAGLPAAKRVKDPDLPGRVSLRTALQIVQAMGLDLEVVAREAPDRDDG